ncbi:SDR family NAD(P)-dependent oxidoreductase [Microcella alkalica]|uniref:SDR family NAD(P)-dependent oxidoreductase n=1 Tax=Microcella alkalica TaxID=355930 RepID=UPI001B7CDF8E|nr:SDR family oxidoreductase [Microcella alkalica]
MAELAGSSILILGATGGLGRHLVRQLADAGARLVLTGRSQAALDALEVPGIAIAGDLRDPELPRTLVATAIMAYGRLDGVVNATGVVAFGPAAEVSDEVLDELWQINALAPMRIVRAAAPALAEAKAEGSQPFIVHFSGLVSEAPTAGLGAYSAVKSALAVYQQVAGRELRRQDIRVLDARPGHTETELSRHPIAGETPKLPTGYDPEGVARRVIAAIVADEKDLPSSAFTEVPAAESQMVPVEPADINTGAHPAVRMAAQMPLEASAPVTSSSEPSSAAEQAPVEEASPEAPAEGEAPVEATATDEAPVDAPDVEEADGGSAASAASAASVASPASPDSAASPASVDSPASVESAPSAPDDAAAEGDEPESDEPVHAEAVEYVAPEPLVEPGSEQSETHEHGDAHEHGDHEHHDHEPHRS